MKSTPVRTKAMALVDITPFLPAAAPVNDALRRKLSAARLRATQIRKVAAAFADKLKELEGEDKLGNFEIHDLMGDFNELETRVLNLTRTRDDIACLFLGKL